MPLVLKETVLSESVQRTNNTGTFIDNLCGVTVIVMRLILFCWYSNTQTGMSTSSEGNCPGGLEQKESAVQGYVCY